MSVASVEERPLEVGGRARSVELVEPIPHQASVLLADERFKVLICGRRWGKTVVSRAAALVGHGAGLRRRGALYGGQVWFVLPTLPMARDTWDAFDLALRDVWTRRNVTERFFDLPGGGRLSVKSGDQPERLRGSGLDGVVLDELKDHASETWRAIRPALADKLGWLIACGSPGDPVEGDLSHELAQRCDGRPDWRLWQRPTSDNPIVLASEIADMRAELGEFRFAREVLAQFNVAGGVLFRPEWERRYARDERGWIVCDGEPAINPAGLVRFGTVDLAVSLKTSSDWTVIASWGVDAAGRLFLLDLARARIDGAAILAALVSAVRRHGLGSVWIEETAYHAHLIDLAAREGVPVRGLKADRDKVTRAHPAAAAMERGRVWVPSEAPWLVDWRREVYAFPHGEFDDQVDTLSYAVHLLAEVVEAQKQARRRQPAPEDSPRIVRPDERDGWWNGMSEPGRW